MRRLGAALAVALVGFPLACGAVEFGPGADLRALRRDAPILVRHFTPGATVAIDDIVVSGNDALVAWTWSDARVKSVKDTWMGTATMATSFRRRDGRWWVAKNFGAFRPATGIDANQIARTLGVAPATAHVFQTQLPEIGKELFIERTVEPFACAACTSMLSDSSRFDATFGYNLQYGYSSLILGFKGRAGMGRSLYDFSLSSDATDTLPFTEAHLAVWFPYVLDASRDYALFMDTTQPPVDGIVGSLADNTLTFAIPAFSLLPREPAPGSIAVANGLGRSLFCASGTTGAIPFSPPPGFEPNLAVAVVEIASPKAVSNASVTSFALSDADGKTLPMKRVVSVEVFERQRSAAEGSAAFFLNSGDTTPWNGTLPAGKIRLRVKVALPSQPYAPQRYALTFGPYSIAGPCDVTWPT